MRQKILALLYDRDAVDPDDGVGPGSLAQNRWAAPIKTKREEATDNMAIVKDPEGNETSTLHEVVDFKDLRVLEVGCGGGRLTWRYAEKAAHVTAIDPIAEDIETARGNVPTLLKGRISFVESTIEVFATSTGERRFDIAIFAWSL
jgi:2-polyprenyl-3-methyl-5-hydroxy-6-metoxy-1,4-benzoquinol methylase